MDVRISVYLNVLISTDLDHLKSSKADHDLIFIL